MIAVIAQVVHESQRPDDPRTDEQLFDDLRHQQRVIRRALHVPRPWWLRAVVSVQWLMVFGLASASAWKSSLIAAALVLLASIMWQERRDA